MSRLTAFLLSREVRNYVRWRVRRNPLAAVSIPLEWASAVLAIRRARLSDAAAKQETNASAAPRVVSPPAHFLVHPDDVDALAALSRRLFSQDVGAVIEKAERICNGRIPLVTGIEIDWATGGWRPAVDDIEHVFCLNRWPHGVILAKAWAYTRNARYAARWSELLEDWIARNPADAASPVWESYSVSERIVNWCLCLSLFWAAPRFQESMLSVLSAQLAEHARWLAAHLESRTAHNHLINNARALYVYGTLFGVARDRELGWAILERELFRQVLPDGMLGEQSTHYHLLLTRTYVEACLIAMRSGQSIADAVLDRVRRMLAVAVAFIRPDGSIPVVGDFSPDTDVSSLVGMAGVGQWYLAAPPRDQPPLSEPALWYMRPEEAQACSAVCSVPECRSVYLPDAGYSICKSPHLDVVFQADPRADLIRHGHADLLGVSVWARGCEVLTDSGNASYTASVWLDYFRGAAAHNVLTVDGLPAYLPTGNVRRLLAADYGRGTVRMWPPEQVERWWCAQAEHTGYARVAEDLTVRRRLIVTAEYVWISDWVEGGRVHVLDAYWHCGANAVRETAPGRWDILSEQRTVGRAIWMKDNRPVAPSWVTAQEAPTPQGWFSPAYGVKQASPTAMLQATFSGSVRLDLLLWLEPETPVTTFVPEDRDKAAVASASWTDELDLTPTDRRLRGGRRVAA